MLSSSKEIENVCDVLFRLWNASLSTVDYTDTSSYRYSIDEKFKDLNRIFRLLV